MAKSARNRESTAPPERSAGDAACAKLHLLFGWWMLLAFLLLGFVLEGLHAFKSPWYLSVGNEARRLMFTLAHAHGTLLALVNIVFGVCCYVLPLRRPGLRAAASRLLISGALVLPLGFLLGGAFIYDGDPGLGVWLVPIGALLLVVGVAAVAILISLTL